MALDRTLALCVRLSLDESSLNGCIASGGTGTLTADSILRTNSDRTEPCFDLPMTDCMSDAACEIEACSGSGRLGCEIDARSGTGLLSTSGARTEGLRRTGGPGAGGGLLSCGKRLGNLRAGGEGPETATSSCEWPVRAGRGWKDRLGSDTPCSMAWCVDVRITRIDAAIRVMWQLTRS